MKRFHLNKLITYSDGTILKKVYVMLAETGL